MATPKPAARKRAAKKPAIRFTKRQMDAIREMFLGFMQSDIKPRVMATVEEEMSRFHEAEQRLAELEFAVRRQGIPVSRPMIGL
jgi:hypothetical protein